MKADLVPGLCIEKGKHGLRSLLVMTASVWVQSVPMFQSGKSWNICMHALHRRLTHAIRNISGCIRLDAKADP